MHNFKAVRQMDVKVILVYTVAFYVVKFFNKFYFESKLEGRFPNIVITLRVFLTVGKEASLNKTT